jgi:hypothetical protein
LSLTGTSGVPSFERQRDTIHSIILRFCATLPGNSQAFDMSEFSFLRTIYGTLILSREIRLLKYSVMSYMYIYKHVLNCS